MLISVSGGVMFGMVAVAGYFVATASQDIAPAAMFAIEAMLAATAVCAVLAVIKSFTWRLTLSEEAVEASSWIGRRRLRCDQIAGRRTIKKGGYRSLIIVATTPRPRNITVVSTHVALDAVWSAFYEGLRDLDAEDLRASLAEIAANPAFGATTAQRLRALARARRIGGVLTLVAFAVMLWALVAPRPYGLAIASLAMLPVLAVILVVVSKGLFRIGSGSRDSHVDLGAACALVSLVILFRMILDSHLFSWVPLLVAAVLCAGLVVVTIAAVERGLRRRATTFVAIGLFAWAYAFGTLGEGNRLLDRSPSMLRSQVLGKDVSRGKYTHYRLRLAPWGPLREAGAVEVSRAVYESLQPGQIACVLLGPGAMGVPWFDVVACPDHALAGAERLR